MAWEWIKDNPTLSKALSGTALAMQTAAPAVEDWLYRGAEGAKSSAEEIAKLAKSAKDLPWKKAVSGATPKWLGGSGQWTFDPSYKGVNKLPLSKMFLTGGDPLGRKVYQGLSRVAGPISRLGSAPLLAAQMLGKEAGQEKLLSKNPNASGWKQSMIDPTHSGLAKGSKGGLISQGTDKQSGSTFRTDTDQTDQETPVRKTVNQTTVSPLRASRQAAGRAQRKAKKEFGAGSAEHLKAIGVTEAAGKKLKRSRGRK
jgi:hypothetical protein